MVCLRSVFAAGAVAHALPVPYIWPSLGSQVARGRRNPLTSRTFCLSRANKPAALMAAVTYTQSLSAAKQSECHGKIIRM